MTDRSPPSPACRRCRHRVPVTGACGHGLRSTLIAEFSARPDRACPAFRPIDPDR